VAGGGGGSGGGLADGREDDAQAGQGAGGSNDVWFGPSDPLLGIFGASQDLTLATGACRGRELHADDAGPPVLATTTPAPSAASRQAVVLRRHGAALFRDGEHRLAAQAFSRALELNPEDAGACLANRSAALGALGDLRGALQDATRAVSASGGSWGRAHYRVYAALVMRNAPKLLSAAGPARGSVDSPLLETPDLAGEEEEEEERGQRGESASEQEEEEAAALASLCRAHVLGEDVGSRLLSLLASILAAAGQARENNAVLLAAKELLESDLLRGLCAGAREAAESEERADVEKVRAPDMPPR
jgi:tetratricopeptide (TPR) repeat protein